MDALFADAMSGKFGEKFSDPQLFEVTEHTPSALIRAMSAGADDAELSRLACSDLQAATRALEVLELLCLMHPAHAERNGWPRKGTVIALAVREKIEADCLAAIKHPPA